MGNLYSHFIFLHSQLFIKKQVMVEYSLNTPLLPYRRKIVHSYSFCQWWFYSHQIIFSIFFLAVAKPEDNGSCSNRFKVQRNSSKSSGKNLHCSYANLIQSNLTAVGFVHEIMPNKQKSRKSVRRFSESKGWRKSKVSNKRVLPALCSWRALLINSSCFW